MDAGDGDLVMADYAPSFVGFVDINGKLSIDRLDHFKAYCKHFAGNEVEVEVRKRRSRRGLKANAFYWAAVLPPIAHRLEGWTVDEVHEAMKAKFLGREDLEHGLSKIGSSAKLNVEEFAQYLDSIILWAAETLGVVIDVPEPKAQKQKARAA